MAAHLLRYKTELNRIGLILSDLRNHRQDMTQVPTRNEDELACTGSSPAVDHEAQRIERLASNLTATSKFCDELEKKVRNILALVGSIQMNQMGAYILTISSYSTKFKR
jgi:hypothetical protein